MKKFLFMGAIAAMLLGTASCSSDMEPEMTDGTVQFKVELPGAIDSRTISDGTTANKLAVAVYDSEGNELTDLSLTGTKVVTMSDKTATVTFKLVKGQTYSFAFWAQADGAPYTFNTASKTINVDYGDGKVACNNESRDAFYAYKTYEVTGPVNETIKLTRPFAQLNFGADDLAAAAKAGITPSQSQVVVSKVGTAFNLATGATSGEKDDVTFTLAAIPTDQLKVQDKTYGWMAMNYFLAPGDDAIISATMTVKTNKADVVVPATNVPVKKNHRTNIVGSLFTEDANFNVIIDERFDQPDLAPEKVWDGVTINEPRVEGETVYITSNEEFAWLNGTNLTEKNVRIIELQANLNMGNHPSNPRALNSYSNPMRELRFNGNSHSIKGLAEPLFASTWAGAAKVYISNLTIDQSTIVSDEEDTKKSVGVGAFIGWPQASAIIDLTNCHVTNSTIKGGHWTGGLFGIAAGYSGTDGPVFEEVTVTNCSVENCTITGKGSCGSLMGHGAASDWTKVTATDCTFKNNTIRGAGSNKTGVVLGTIGAAGLEKTVNGVSHTGGIYINNATVEGNTAFSAETQVTRWAGRIGSKGGRLYVDGVDITKDCPDTENY